VADDGNESDEGGIVMVNNDEDGLRHVACEPVPDDDEDGSSNLRTVPSDPVLEDGENGSSSRVSERRGEVEDQKFLGSFPKGKKKVTASEMGLF
jgi:hypothetical protein